MWLAINFFKKGGLVPILMLLRSPIYASGIFENNVIVTGFLITLLILAISILMLTLSVKSVVKGYLCAQDNKSFDNYAEYLNNLTSSQIEDFLNTKKRCKNVQTVLLVGAIILGSSPTFAQTDLPNSGNLLSQYGVLITVVLIAIPILSGIVLLIVKVRHQLKRFRRNQSMAEVGRLVNYLNEVDDENILSHLQERKIALDFVLNNQELSGDIKAVDQKGFINKIIHNPSLPIVARKRKASDRPKIDSELAKLIIYFIASATFWLIFGTMIGEYVGIKFVAPDIDHQSWLSFGRLRTVHTNAVFWGWASLAMLGLGHYIVPMVSNTKLYSMKMGWWTLILVNVTVLLGSITLMVGINNGGGEYREYIWPVMLFFAVGILLSFINFFKTIGNRTTKEIYISNWYIVSAIIFGIIITLVAYLPFWQNGLGETIIQGYYMHQGVGMWFMLFTLGIVYYFLPQQLKKPIYSYSLGILAFWTQILFYTLIGTHHFVFSSIPWWLQTIAIVGSVGMVIPVIAGTTNFLLTFKGAWFKIPDSYTLPFFLTGILFYCTGSLQGTAEAFRSTNLIWHFTDFTVAHSHLTMYGIICFFLWAGIYAVIPRITGMEPPQVTVGMHFWLALIGLLFYTIPLMYGSTLRGVMWLEGKAFIDSVSFMAPFWLWRAIGGSLMFFSHLIFAYNLYRMLVGNDQIDVKNAAFEKLKTIG